MHSESMNLRVSSVSFNETVYTRARVYTVESHEILTHFVSLRIFRGQGGQSRNRQTSVQCQKSRESHGFGGVRL